MLFLLQDFCQEIAGDMGGLLFLTAESVAEHEERSLLASLRLASVASVIVWALDYNIELAMVALYGGMLG